MSQSELGAGAAAIVVGIGGLQVAGRHAPTPSAGPCLRVMPVSPVVRPGHPPVVAQLGDGSVWRRHWPEDDRLVIEFVGVALVEVADGAGQVVFDRELTPDLEEHLLLDHVLPLVLARQGRVVVHGALVSRRGAGVVLLGSSGAGKSTLVAHLWQHGWTLGGDDCTVISAARPPTAEPTYPTLRLANDAVELLGIPLHQSVPVAGKRRVLPSQRLSSDAVPVQLIAVLDSSAVGPPSFIPLRGVDAHAALFGSTFHADFGHHRLPRVVADLASIAAVVPVGRLETARDRRSLSETRALLEDLLDRLPDVSTVSGA